ncbi:hypothetical protein HDV00_003520 [Rhizophlyctis rosea]|nr:hypothetical protein HDV00_003520 [Rhizophlyctis rosea]
MYGLFQFYIVIHNDIASAKPLWKVIAVKFVVFFSFWQSIALSALDNFGVLHGGQYWTADNLADLIQSFLLIAAFLHIKAFSHHEFMRSGSEGLPDKSQRTPILKSMINALSPMDILKDIIFAPKEVRVYNQRKREKKTRRKLDEFKDEFEDDRISMVDMNSPRVGHLGGESESEDEDYGSGGGLSSMKGHKAVGSMEPLNSGVGGKDSRDNSGFSIG